MELGLPFLQIGIALGLGLLVGIERERVASRLAGVRTFPMVTVLGVLSATLARSFGGFVVPGAMIALAALIIIGNVARLREPGSAPGLTTEVALLLMFAVGAFLVVGPIEIAVVVGAGVAVLLQAKIELHGMVARLGDDDLRAIMRFALISLVILPVLPNRAFDPYDVLNPHQIWLMVVLIVGISLSGYVLYKFFGERAGLLLGGLLGGLISSTATTVSYARRSTRAPEASDLAAIVILLAGSVLVPRVMMETAVVAPGFFKEALGPLTILGLAAASAAVVAWYLLEHHGARQAPQGNPSELTPALVFAFLYATVLFAVAAAKEHLGRTGLYGVAALSGLTDVDAITLSTAQLVDAGRLDPREGWSLIVTAILSNVVFKTATVAVLGPSGLFRRVAYASASLLVTGVLLLVYW